MTAMHTDIGILADIGVFVLQITCKTALKNFLKASWKRLKPLVSFAFLKVRDLSKRLTPIKGHTNKAWTEKGAMYDPAN